MRTLEGREKEFKFFDPKLLLATLGQQVFLSPINSGNARRNAVARSRTIFTSYHDWLSKGWPIIGSQQRPRSSSPAEVVVKRPSASEPLPDQRVPCIVLY